MNATITALLLMFFIMMVKTQQSLQVDEELKQTVELSRHLIAMKLEIAEMKAGEEDSRQEMVAMKRQLAEMTAREEASKQEISDLKLQVHNSNGLLKTLNYQVAELKDDNSQLQRQFANRQNNTFVGFTAYPTDTRPYEYEELVLFDGIHTNYGEGYNPQLSVFQCPVAGYYMFSINIYTKPNKGMRPQIYINREEQTTFPSTYSDHQEDDTSSTMVITYCDVGDLVWVRDTSEGDHEMWGGTQSSFSGALLAAAG